MQRRTFLAMAICALMLALPMASADWRGRGFVEPDTERDREGGYMWTDPDTNPDPAVRQIYFNTYATYFIASVNHNVGALGTQSMAYPTSVHAILGIWKDCNQDGFIGQAEGVLLEYPSSLLLDSSVCPATPGDYTQAGYQPRHNDGAWVLEFLPIGPDGPGNNVNPFNVNDPTAKIWGDFGLPEWEAEPTCPLNPRPTGTYRSTGGFLRYADCFTGWKTLDTINLVAHSTGQHHLAFDDVEEEPTVRRPHESGSTLNVQNPWGTEGDASMANVWDCSQDGTAIAAPNPDMQDEEGNLMTLRTPSTGASLNPAGSPAGTVNETEEGMHSCDRNDDDADSGGPYQNFAETPYFDESPFEGTGTKRKQTDFEFRFIEGRGGCPSSNQNVRRVCPLPPFGGLNLMRNNDAVDGQLHSAGYWYGEPGYVGSRNPYVNRLTLQPRGAVYTTAYATVDAASATVAGTLPPGAATGIYGSYHCGTVPTGLWECDTSRWWIDGTTGEDISGPHNVVPGAEYNLVDVDCYDGSTEHTPDLSMSLVGEVVCAR